MDKFELTDQNCKAFMVWLDQSGLSWNTRRTYKSFLKRLQKEIGYISMETLPKILKMGKDGKVIHQNKRAVLHAINKYCFENKIDFTINIPSYKAEERKMPNTLTNNEIKALISSASPVQSLMIRCIFNMGAGLRISELLKLSWKNINWADWLENKENFGKFNIREAKGDKFRVVTVPPKLMQDLFNLAEIRGIINEFGIPEGGMIFWLGEREWRNDLFKENEQEWRNQYVRHAYRIFEYEWEKLCFKVLAKKTNIHSLRHSKATYLYDIENVPIEIIQKLLGHRSLNTTMIYTQISMNKTFTAMKNTKEL